MISPAKSLFSYTQLLPIVICLLLVSGAMHSLLGQSASYNVTTPWALPPIPGEGNRFVTGPDGTLYFTSTVKNGVFKFSPDGTVTTLAGGSTQYALVDGMGENVRFNGPADLAWDPQGNLFVLDSGNLAIRKVTPAGVVSTFVGGIGAGYADGNPATAKFGAMNNIASDTAGNLYIVDTGNLAVRRVTPDGNVSTIAKGILNPQYVPDFSPRYVAVGPNDEVYVLTSNLPSIWKIELTGTRTLIAGPAALEPATSASGGAVQGFRSDRNGDFFVVSTGGEWKVPKNGGTVTSFSDGWDVAWDNSGNTYLLGVVLKKVAPNGAVTELAGRASGFVDGPARTARFNNPVGMVRDRQGNFFVADMGNHAIRKIAPDHTVTTFAGGVQGFADGNGTTAKFNSPMGLAIDKTDTIYVADSDNNSIRAISPTGEVTTLAGRDGTAGMANGPLAMAKFDRPGWLAIDPGGKIYVSDLGNHSLRWIAAGWVNSAISGFGAAGMIFNSKGELFCTSGDAVWKITGLPLYPVQTLFAGGFDYGLVDGVGGAAYFSIPSAMAMDQDENIYVADSSNYAIRKITSEALVTTIAGNGYPGFADGFGPRANFHSPWGIALGDNGEIYVADSTNNTIRMLTPPPTAPSNAVITITVE